MGAMFGFRGNAEHTFLEDHNITHGEFLKSHPFAGRKYYGTDGLLNKTHKLSYHQDYVRETKNHMRLPKMNDDPTSDDLLGAIQPYLQKMAPGQKTDLLQTSAGR